MTNISKSALAVNFHLFEEMKGVEAASLAMTKELARTSKCLLWKGDIKCLLQ